MEWLVGIIFIVVLIRMFNISLKESGKSLLQHNKATQILASYSCWNYEFNKKVREKFRNISKSFLTESNDVDYSYVANVAHKSKNLHILYLFLMMIVGLYIVNAFIKIIDGYDSISEILFLFTLGWFFSFVYNILKYKLIFNIENTDTIEKNNNIRVPQKNQNICIFSGKKPFIGDGTTIKNVSFVISTNKAKKLASTELNPIDFLEDEIYNFIANKLCDFGDISQKLYINGCSLNENKDILSAIDTGIISQELWEKYCLDNSGDVRHYIKISQTNPTQEIQTTLFIRFVKREKSLFVEMTTLVLPPIASKYRILEQLPSKISFSRFILLAQTSFLTTIIQLPKAIFYGFGFIATIKERLFAENILRKQIEENPLFDYGETKTLREETADTSLQNFYNSMDDEHLSKQIEKAFFENLIEFLNSKNIDTSELSQQEATIINHGLMVSGDVQADKLAVGKKVNFFGNKTKGGM